MTDLALLDQAVTHVRQHGPWAVSLCWGQPLAHFTTIEAIRAEYRRLSDARPVVIPCTNWESAGLSGARTVPRFD